VIAERLLEESATLCMLHHVHTCQPSHFLAEFSRFLGIFLPSYTVHRIHEIPLLQTQQK